MKFGASSWRWGEEPPAWIMKEFKKALYLMGKNSETFHSIDVSEQWSFFIAIAPQQKRELTLNLFSQAIQGMCINSEAYFPDIPRAAVHGDLYS